MLYKYATLNSEYTIANVLESKFWFNTPILFNDPFDIYPIYNLDNAEKEILLQIFEQADLDRKQTSKFSNFELSELMRWQDKMLGDNSRYGVTCFSILKDNIIMWSHYADSHKGICLGFDINDGDCIDSFLDKSRNAESGKLIGEVFPIIYKDKSSRPRSKFDNGKQFEIYKTKYKQWLAEKEVRVMLRAERKYTFPCLLYYKTEKLKEINFGANITWKDFLDKYLLLADYIRKHNITTYIATLDEYEYRLNFAPVAFCEYLQQYGCYQRLMDMTDFIQEITILKRFSSVYGLDATKSYWQYALANLPMYFVQRLAMDDLLKVFTDHGINKYAERNVVCKIGLFLNWICDMMFYLRKKDEREQK